MTWTKAATITISDPARYPNIARDGSGRVIITYSAYSEGWALYAVELDVDKLTLSAPVALGERYAVPDHCLVVVAGTPYLVGQAIHEGDENTALLAGYRLAKGETWAATEIPGLLLPSGWLTDSPYSTDRGQAVIHHAGGDRALVEISRNPECLRLFDADALAGVTATGYGPIAGGLMLWASGANAIHADCSSARALIVTPDDSGDDIAEIQHAVECDLCGYGSPLFGYRKHEWGTKYGNAYFYYAGESYQITDIADPLYTAQNTSFLLVGTTLYIVYHEHLITDDEVSACYLQAWTWAN